MKFKIIENHICAPQGFLASGINAGIRKNPNKPDLAIIYSKIPAISAGVFTKNQVKAAPVLLTQQHIKKINYKPSSSTVATPMPARESKVNCMHCKWQARQPNNFRLIQTRLGSQVQA